MEQQDLPQLPPLPPAPAPAAPSSLGHMSHQQPPQPGPQISPHQQTAHLQPSLPPPQFSFGESTQPPPYDFHQHPPYEYQQQQQPHSQDFQQQQQTQFNMVGGLPDSGGYGGLPPPQGWPPQGPFTPSNIGPGLDGGPGLGHQVQPYPLKFLTTNEYFLIVLILHQFLCFNVSWVYAPCHFYVVCHVFAFDLYIKGWFLFQLVYSQCKCKGGWLAGWL